MTKNHLQKISLLVRICLLSFVTRREIINIVEFHENYQKLLHRTTVVKIISIEFFILYVYLIDKINETFFVFKTIH